MISQLTGTIINTDEKRATLEVGGIGYDIFMSPGTLLGMHEDLENKKTIYTYLHVREDKLDLYGFASKDEKKFFELVISVSGIGPRGALGVLDVAPLGTLVSAITQGDSSYLTKVSGVGKKTAQKIVLELRDKIEKLGIKSDDISVREDSDVVEALISLGYTTVQARDAMKNVPEEITDMNEKIKYALKNLG